MNPRTIALFAVIYGLALIFALLDAALGLGVSAP